MTVVMEEEGRMREKYRERSDKLGLIDQEGTKEKKWSGRSQTSWENRKAKLPAAVGCTLLAVPFAGGRLELQVGRDRGGGLLGCSACLQPGVLCGAGAVCPTPRAWELDLQCPLRR